MRHRVLLWPQVGFVACLAQLFCMTLPAPAQEKTDEQRRSEAVQRELKRLMEDERREQSKRDFETVVVRAQRAKQLTDDLLSATQAFAQRTETLLRSDEGKKLAADPVSLVAYVDLLDHPAVTVEDVRARSEALASTLQLLKNQEEMVAEGHRPTDIVQDDVQQSYFWVSDAKNRFTAQQIKLDTILAKAPPIADPAKAILLDEAIRNHRTRMTQLSAQAQVKGQEIAADATRQTLVDASVLAQLQETQAEASRLIAESKAQADRQKVEYEARIAELQKTIDSEKTRMRIEAADRAAELERKEKKAEADRFAGNVDAELDRDKTVTNAQKKRLVQRCNEPDVQQTLAPFLAKGYLRPDGTHNSVSFKGNYDSVHPVPISYNDLFELGALNPSGSGCDALYSIGADRRDTMRTRWTRVHDWRTDSKTQTLVPKAQALLIELGPTLVELGMLQK